MDSELSRNSEGSQRVVLSGVLSLLGKLLCFGNIRLLRALGATDYEDS